MSKTRARKPREIRHQRTRQRILDAARALVLEGGHERLSLRAVARAVDYSPAGLYEYFSGKDDILAALCAEANEELRCALAAADHRELPSAERLVALGMAYVAFARAHPEDFLLLFSRLRSTRQSLAEAVPAESAYGLLRSAVLAASEGASLDVQTVEHVTYGLWATMHGMAMLQLTHLAGFDADFPSADRATLEAVVSGLTS